MVDPSAHNHALLVQRASRAVRLQGGHLQQAVTQPIHLAVPSPIPTAPLLGSDQQGAPSRYPAPYPGLPAGIALAPRARRTLHAFAPCL
jgi:hypothetical protein